MFKRGDVKNVPRWLMNTPGSVTIDSGHCGLWATLYYSEHEFGHLQFAADSLEHYGYLKYFDLFLPGLVAYMPFAALSRPTRASCKWSPTSTVYPTIQCDFNKLYLCVKYIRVDESVYLSSYILRNRIRKYSQILDGLDTVPL